MELIVAAVLKLMSVEKFCAPVSAEVVTEQVTAAIAAEKATGVDAYLLLGIAYVESCYQATQVSYSLGCSGEGAKRRCRRGHATLRTLKQPEGARASYYCGPTQVGGWVSWERCVELMRDVRENYLYAANHLKKWMNDPNCSKRSQEDRLTCALLGNGGGYPAIDAWSTKSGHRVVGYPGRCLHRASQLRRFAQTAPKI